MADEYETIRVDVSDEGIVHIILNRPRVLNAINTVMIQEVTEVLRTLERDPQTRCFLLSGEGRAFSAGFDLKESATAGDRTTQDWRRVLETDFDFIMQFWDCPKPTISAIHGFCIGGGLELALACDIAVAGADAIFGEPEVRFGSGIVAMLLPWMVGPKHAKDILLTGNDQVSAQRATEMGLVTEKVEEGCHVQRAFEKASEIAAAAPLAIELTKRALNRGYDIRGMRNALLAAVETDIIIETSGGVERSEFNRIRRDEGLKAAIAWRNSR